MEMKLSRSSAGKLAAVCKLNEPRPLSRCWPFTSATHNQPLSLSAPSHCEPPLPPALHHHHLSAVTQLSSPGRCSTQRTSSPSPPQTKTSTLLNLFVPSGSFHPRRHHSLSGSTRWGEGVSIWGRDSFTGAASKFSVSDKTFPHYNKCIQQI